MMNKVFTISDLHLSFSRPKPMDIFGDHWINHPRKIANRWKEKVQDTDVVLIGGDISWAMKLADAILDLEFIDELPGQKVIIRGNHDFWYPKSAQKRKSLPSSITALYRSSCVINEIAYIGCKGLSFDEDDVKDVVVYEKNLKRQVGNLDASMKHLIASGKNYSSIVAMVHYPPAGLGQIISPITELLEGYGVSKCIYGHLHTEEDFKNAISGDIGSVSYFLTSADYLSFEPLQLCPSV